jgi:SAM-dependent MidA family methyltransferase
MGDRNPDTDTQNRLKACILSRIAAEGPVPFSRFMEWCLYHPEYGYYRTGKVRTGKEGDFFTGPCVHPLFGRLLARQISQMARILGEDRFDLVEMGGGRGHLCRDILAWAEGRDPDFYRRLTYTVVDYPASFEAADREGVPRRPGTEKVVRVDPERFFGEGRPRRGCLLSNELVDAFPVHRVVMENGTLREIYVGADREGRFAEVLGEPSDPRLFAYFEASDVVLEEGQKAEVNLRALDWMEHVSRILERGFVMTIDFGYPAEELYAPFRREGTLLCYEGHRTCDNPYEFPGDRDITSHVDFSALIRKGRETGLEPAGLVPQYRFLIGLGLIEELEAWQRGMSELDGLRTRLAVKHLIEPEAGMGEVFKVLVQYKGISAPALDGLRDLGALSVPGSSA